MAIGLFNKSGFDAITIYTTQMNSILELISTWPTFSDYTQKLQRLMPNLIERARSAFEPSGVTLGETRKNLLAVGSMH